MQLEVPASLCALRRALASSVIISHGGKLYVGDTWMNSHLQPEQLSGCLTGHLQPTSFTRRRCVMPGTAVTLKGNITAPGEESRASLLEIQPTKHEARNGATRLHLTCLHSLAAHSSWPCLILLVYSADIAHATALESLR